jgi:hypothetical protein
VKVRWKAVVSALSCHRQYMSANHCHNLVVGTHVSEVHDAELSKRRDDLAANLVGNVELGQGHVR